MLFETEVRSSDIIICSAYVTVKVSTFINYESQHNYFNCWITYIHLYRFGRLL